MKKLQKQDSYRSRKQVKDKAQGSLNIEQKLILKGNTQVHMLQL